MAKAKFETFTGEDGQHYARLKATNGESLFVSEGYKHPQSALHAIFVLVGIVQASFYEILDEAGKKGEGDGS